MTPEQTEVTISGIRFDAATFRYGRIDRKDRIGDAHLFKNNQEWENRNPLCGTRRAYHEIELRDVGPWCLCCLSSVERMTKNPR